MGPPVKRSLLFGGDERPSTRPRMSLQAIAAAAGVVTVNPTPAMLDESRRAPGTASTPPVCEEEEGLAKRLLFECEQDASSSPPRATRALLGASPRRIGCWLERMEKVSATDGEKWFETVVELFFLKVSVACHLSLTSPTPPPPPPTSPKKQRNSARRRGEPGTRARAQRRRPGAPGAARRRPAARRARRQATPTSETAARALRPTRRARAHGPRRRQRVSTTLGAPPLPPRSPSSRTQRGRARARGRASGAAQRRRLPSPTAETGPPPSPFSSRTQVRPRRRQTHRPP